MSHTNYDNSKSLSTGNKRCLLSLKGVFFFKQINELAQNNLNPKDP